MDGQALVILFLYFFCSILGQPFKDQSMMRLRVKQGFYYQGCLLRLLSDGDPGHAINSTPDILKSLLTLKDVYVAEQVHLFGQRNH